jgi:hypothetical protein
MNNTKACPYCGETVLNVAVKCKHCGSSIGGSSVAVKKLFGVRPTFAVIGVILVSLFSAVRIYIWAKTGSPSGVGFTDAGVVSVEQSIWDDFAERRHVTVEEVRMMKVSSRTLTGFAHIKVPLLGLVSKACTATMGEDGQVMWECK